MSILVHELAKLHTTVLHAAGLLLLPALAYLACVMGRGGKETSTCTTLRVSNCSYSDRRWGVLWLGLADDSREINRSCTIWVINGATEGICWKMLWFTRNVPFYAWEHPSLCKRECTTLTHSVPETSLTCVWKSDPCQARDLVTCPINTGNVQLHGQWH